MESYTLMTSFDPAVSLHCPFQADRLLIRIVRTRNRMRERFSGMWVTFLLLCWPSSNLSSTQYKANYDLVNRAVPGPSRTTRRSQTERRQTITTPSYNLPSFPAASQPKPKIKTNTAVWESLAAARKKSREERENAKEKRREAEMEMEQSKEGKKETGRTKVREEKVEEQERGYEEERQYEQHEQEQEKEEKDKEQEQEKEQDAQQEVAAEKVEAEAAALPQDSQRPADGDSILLVGNEEIQGAAEEPLPTILVRTNGNQNMKENRAAGVSEKRKRKASMTNGHIGESISVISRRSSRFKAPDQDLPKEPARRVTRHSSLASISFIIDVILRRVIIYR